MKDRLLAAVFGFLTLLLASGISAQTVSTSVEKHASVNESAPDVETLQKDAAQTDQVATTPARELQSEIDEEKESSREEHKDLTAGARENTGDLMKPFGTQEHFVQSMAKERGEDPNFLGQRYDRALALILNQDLYREKETRAFLMTPREKFCRKWNLKRAYDHAFLDIGFGVTISGPHLVGKMTSALDVKPGEKVLEIGTGSGYQSAVLSNLTDRVYSIEIIEKLANQTDGLYSDLAGSGYAQYGKIMRKADDGYYGWEEYAPFDKILVTCGIDHIPPPLLKQLSVGGDMVIPVGPPGAQVVLKVTKTKDEDGNFIIAREDIYHGKKKVPFVPFTKKGGGTHFK